MSNLLMIGYCVACGKARRINRGGECTVCQSPATDRGPQRRPDLRRIRFNRTIMYRANIARVEFMAIHSTDPNERAAMNAWLAEAREMEAIRDAVS